MKKCKPWSEKLQEVLKVLELTQSQLAEKAGTYQSYISDIIKGRNNNPSAKFLSLLAHLGISCDWLLKDEGSILRSSDVVGIPLYDIQASAGRGSIADFFDNPDIITWLNIRDDIVQRYGSREIGAVKIYGDSMEPTYHTGDAAVFARDLIDGDGVYLIGLDNDLFIKRLQFFPERNQVIMKSDNPLYEPRVIDAAACQVYFKIIGRVVSVVKLV